jgi:hypothetical protein
MSLKVELFFQHFDEWMIRWRKYQTKEDWEIELRRQQARKRNYVCTAGVVGASALWTAAPGTIIRITNKPDFFDIGYDTQLKAWVRKTLNGAPRWTPNGYGRIGAIFVPALLTISLLERRSENARLNDYLQAKTVFGEQCRRFKSTGKIEEFLPVNIKASVPEEDLIILPQ